MANCVVIALFRHGLTEENDRKAYLGWNDSPLSRDLSEIVTTKNYERYFSSDLKRCITTANQLFPNKEFILLKDLREMNFGLWEGKTYKDLKDNPLYQQWLTNPFHHTPPQGESFSQFKNRIQKGWKTITNELFSKDNQSCAVITHGGVIRYLLSEFAPDRKGFWDWDTPHSKGFELIFEKDTLRRSGRCTLLQEVPLTVKERG